MRRLKSVITSKRALILLEGETEEEFYDSFLRQHCHSAPRRIRNLKGNFSINQKIIDHATRVLKENPSELVEVYVCIDQERRLVPAFNRELCEEELRQHRNFKGIIPVVADLMLESILFLDITGIYDFLRTPLSKRHPKKFANYRNLTHRDLSAVFKEAGKIYSKGHRCANFIANLDMTKFRVAEELKEMVSCLTRLIPKRYKK